MYNSDPSDRNPKLNVASSFIETPTLGAVSGEQKKKDPTPIQNLPKETTPINLEKYPQRKDPGGTNSSIKIGKCTNTLNSHSAQNGFSKITFSGIMILF